MWATVAAQIYVQPGEPDGHGLLQGRPGLVLQEGGAPAQGYGGAGHERRAKFLAALEDWIERRETNINRSLATKFDMLFLPESLEVSFDTHGFVN